MVRPAAEALRRPWRAAALRRTCHGRALAAGKSTGNRFIKGTLQPLPSHGLCSLRPLGERADNKGQATATASGDTPLFEMPGGA
ncbi:hypothetical protein VPH35_075510 [Triticum aestivum]